MNKLANLWSAKSVAVIGATERVGAMGRLPIEYLLKHGYSGEIFPVNPKGGTILGIAAFTSISEIGKPIDLALIMVPSTLVEAAVIDSAKAGIPVVTVMASGFAEADGEGAIAQDRLVAIAKKSGMRLVGPNCIGSVGGNSKLTATFSPVFSSDSTTLSAGSLALVSQSGALGYGTYSLGLDRDLPIGVVVTTGNEAEVSAMDIATALSEDEDVSGILIYTEGLTEVEQLREIASKKPTAILKAGRSEAGAEAAASHTGALATGDRVVDAAIKATGAVRVNNVEELLDAGAVFTTGTKLTGKRVAIITTSGGSGILGTDALEACGLELAELEPKTIATLDEFIPSYGNSTNPVDVTAAVISSPELFEKCMAILVNDKNVDAIIAAFCVLVGDDVERIANALGAAGKSRSLPIVVSRTGAESLAPLAAKKLAQFNIPVFPTPERAARALELLRVVSIPIPKYSRKSLVETTITPAFGASEVELKNLWQSAGIPVPESILVTNKSEVSSAVKKVGGHAVLKVVIPGLLHKSDAGGVALNISEIEAPEVFDQLIAIAKGGQASVLVERFVPKGVEVLVGITPSPLGRVLTIGVGGVLTEVINDTSLRLLPVSSDDVNAMVNETRLAKLFAGVRGAAPSDRAAFIELVLRITDATAGWEDGFELDINPVTVLSDGAWVLDSAYVAANN
ncbi:MAG: acetate--CoA ligase family protein [Acidobacteria bacterium]|nr:acetate--CoA ligase family protein [Acidobacteriota bacterium]